MNCTSCKHRYIRGGWVCWSGNKKSLGKCDNGNPSDDRTIYRNGETKQEDDYNEHFNQGHGNADRPTATVVGISKRKGPDCTK